MNAPIVLPATDAITALREAYAALCRVTTEWTSGRATRAEWLAAAQAYRDAVCAAHGADQRPSEPARDVRQQMTAACVSPVEVAMPDGGRSSSQIDELRALLAQAEREASDAEARRVALWAELEEIEARAEGVCPPEVLERVLIGEDEMPVDAYAEAAAAGALYDDEPADAIDREMADTYCREQWEG